eukprot:846186-Rhodomonas_salina.1
MCGTETGYSATTALSPVWYPRPAEKSSTPTSRYQHRPTRSVTHVPYRLSVAAYTMFGTDKTQQHTRCP